MTEEGLTKDQYIPFLDNWKAPGSSFPLHDHQDEEETFVIEGEVKVGKYHLQRGDYLLSVLATTRKPLNFLK